MIKKILIALLVILMAIQFFRPAKNISEVLISESDLSNTYTISEDVHKIFITKCYDCHSNNTRYPWYNSIQPVAWWMAGHVNEGKEELNFSEFKQYPEKKATHKLEEIAEVLTEGSMPLKSYLWIHHEAKVTDEEKTAINTWLKSLPVVFEKEF